MENLLNALTRWSILKSVGGSYLGALTILTPVVGYLLLVPALEVTFAGVEVVSGFAITSLGQELSSSSRFLYLGLFIIGTATIVFRFACPREVASYIDTADFVQSQKNVYSPLRLRNDIEELRKLSEACNNKDLIEYLSKITVSENKKTGKSSDGARVSAQTTPMTNEEWWGQYELVANSVLSQIYENKDYSWIALRLFLAFLYATGLTMVLVPSFLTFFCVLTMPW